MAVTPDKQETINRRMRLTILIVGGLVIVVMAYLSGVRRRANEIRDVNQRVRVLTSTTSALREDVAAREGTIKQLEARRRLHLTLLAMDERNFGIAQQNLTAAGILLGNASEGNSGLAALSQEMRGLNIVAAGNFAAQREQVLGLARRLDALLPSTLPGAAVETDGTS